MPVVYRICGSCKKGHNPQTDSCDCGLTHSYIRNTQLPEHERPVVWENPNDPNPETRYRYPATYNPSTNADMPSKYKARGFQRKEFFSLREHEKFQRETNTRNYKTWDIRK